MLYDYMFGAGMSGVDGTGFYSPAIGIMAAQEAAAMETLRQLTPEERRELINSSDDPARRQALVTASWKLERMENR